MAGLPDVEAWSPACAKSVVQAVTPIANVNTNADAAIADKYFILSEIPKYAMTLVFRAQSLEFFNQRTVNVVAKVLLVSVALELKLCTLFERIDLLQNNCAGVWSSVPVSAYRER